MSESYTIEFLQTIEKRNNVLKDNNIVLPYNIQSLYSYVETPDGCQVFYPLWADDEK